MTEAAGSRRWRFFQGSSAWVIVAALVLGLAAGMGASAFGAGSGDLLSSVFGTIGGLWLDALRMVVIPLIVALLIKGIVGSAELAREGRMAALAVASFVALYALSAAIGALAMPALLAAFPMPGGAADAIRAGFAAVDPRQVESSVAGVGDFVRSFVPANPIAAAASGEMLQVVVFTLFFAVALALVEPAKRKPVVDFFAAIGDAMLIVIGWVLFVAPLGVFALAFVAGAAAGSGLFGGLLHFVLLYIGVALVLIAIAYGVAVAAAGFGLARFTRAIAPTQAIAFSTQSSAGSLPAMIVSARNLGVSEAAVDTALPLAAALFRVTGPAMNIAVVIFIAHVLGMNIGIAAMAAGVAIATFASVSAPGVPGQVSYFTSIAPIAMAMGVPIAPLGMLIAVEPVPDMFRTVGNVTMDVAVAGAVDRRTRRKGKAAKR